MSALGDIERSARTVLDDIAAADEVLMAKQRAAKLARALLALLPVVRAAEKHEDARRHCEETGRDHGKLVLASEALEAAIDTMRAEIGGEG